MTGSCPVCGTCDPLCHATLCIRALYAWEVEALRTSLGSGATGAQPSGSGVPSCAAEDVTDASHTSTTETAKPSNQELDAMRERAEAIRDGSEWGPNTGHQLARDVLVLVARVEALLADRDAARRDADAFRDVYRSAEEHVSDLAGRVAVLEAALREELDLAEEGWGYDAVAYFRKKWDYEGRAARLGAVLAGGDACDHEWIDIRNAVVESGEMCRKCRALRAGNDASAGGDAAPQTDNLGGDEVASSGGDS